VGTLHSASRSLNIALPKPVVVAVAPPTGHFIQTQALRNPGPSCPAVVSGSSLTVVRAAAPGAPQIWPEASGNIAVDWHPYGAKSEDRAELDRIFAGAAHIASVRLVNQRIVMAPLEPAPRSGGPMPVGRTAPTGSEVTEMLSACSALSARLCPPN
jgi:hypothetical protein